MLRLVATAIVAAGMALSSAAFGQDAPYHIRGVLDAVGDGAITVTDDAGAVLEINLGEAPRVFVVDAASLEDIAENQFVGITSIMVGGDRIALEVHIFEESLRGVGEGHYPWSLVEEENMMTNANVGTMVSLDSGARQLTVDYADGEDGARGTQTIVVPPESAVVHLFAGDVSALQTGLRVFLLAVDTEDGQTNAIATVVGQNGVEPPM